MKHRGDYGGGGYAGDFLGIGGFLKRTARKVFKASPIGQVIDLIAGPAEKPILVVSNGQVTTRRPDPRDVAGPMGFQEAQKVPGPRGVFERLAPGGASGYECPTGGMRGFHLAKDGSGRWVKNRTMNVANPKALRRAIRREQGFVKLAQRSLKGTGYKIARR